jgi:hypothetical protein
MFLALFACTPPTVVESVMVLPARPTTSDTLRCEVHPALPPGALFAWYVQGARIAWTGVSLPGYWFERGQEVACGVAEHPLRSSAAKVGGGLPSLDNVRFEVVDLGPDGHRVRANLEGWFDADGDPQQVRFLWKLEGQPLEGGELLVVPAAAAAPLGAPGLPEGSGARRLSVEVVPLSPEGEGQAVHAEVELPSWSPPEEG